MAGSAAAPGHERWEPPPAAAVCPPAMYSPSDKMMNMKPLPQTPCFPGGRYSPPATYRPVDPMRRCVNTSVSTDRTGRDGRAGCWGGGRGF